MPTTTPPKIGIELFAHINNSYWISGSRLEGRTYTETATYLYEFLKNEIKDLLPGLSSTDQKHLEGLMERLSSLLENAKEINEMPEKLKEDSNNWRFYTYDQRKQNYQKKVETLINPLLEKIKTLKKGKSVLMPGGWSAAPSQDLKASKGHAMVYEFRKDKNEDLIFMVYNSGEGLEFHPSVQKEDKERYQTMLCFKIPKEALKTENTTWFTRFMTDLVAPNVPNMHEDEEYNTEILYKHIFQRVFQVGGERINPADLPNLLGSDFNFEPSMQARSNTNTEKSLNELIKGNLPERNKAKLILLALKVYSIESFLAQNKSPNQTMEAKALLQLRKAVQKLSSSLLKIDQKEIPSALYEKARHLITEVSNYKPSNAPSTHIQDFSTLPLPNDNALSAASSVQSRVRTNPPVKPIPSPDSLVEKPYDQNPKLYAKEAIDLESFSIEKMRNFQENMKGLVEKQYYSEVEKHIFSYFTTLPLTPSYFEALTPQEAVEYIARIDELLQTYSHACEQNQNNKLNPERVALLLNVLDLINLIHTNPKLSLYPIGIDAFYYNEFNFSKFKVRSKYNAYLSTGSPQLDVRINGILKNVNTADYVYPMDVNRVVPYFDKNENKELKKYLENLYERTQWGNNSAKVPFGQDEQIKSSKNYVAITAYFLYLKDDVQGKSIYKSELDKIELIKQSIVLSTCLKKVITNYSLDKLFDKSDMPEFLKLYKNEDEKDKSKSYTILSTLLDNKGLTPIILPKEVSIEYFKKIKDPTIAAILESDFFQYKDQSDSDKYNKGKLFKERFTQANQIFSLANGQNNNTPYSEHNALYQNLVHLRLVPELQFLMTIEYFSNDNLELFSTKKSGASLKRDLEIYLRRNLFQVGLLEAQCKNNPQSLDAFYLFIEQALIYFEEDIGTQLYFYQLQADINRYILDMKSDNNPLLSKLQTFVKQKQAVLLKQVSSINIQSLSSPSDKYTLSKLKLELILEEKPESPQEIFNLYMDLCRYARESILESGEEKEAHQKIAEACLDILLKHKASIYNWAMEKYQKENPELTPEELASLSVEVKYPYFYGKDAQGNKVISLDLTQGRILVKGLYYCTAPEGLLQSTLGKEVLQGRNPNLSVAVCKKEGTDIPIKQYDVLDSDPNKPKERFFECFEPGQPVRWVYQKEKVVQGQKKFYEKQDLRSQDLSLLPSYFHGRDTTFWKAIDQDVLLIEQEGRQYYYDLTANNIQELDANGQLTGFKIVGKQYHDKFSLFTQFESREFTEILFNQSTNSLKINFPRYNLALEGRLVGETWVINMAGNPHLRLINSSNVAMQPVMKNSLVFEDSETKEQIIYTPNQYYYVNPSNLKEIDFETIYYNPILDSANNHKESLLAQADISKKGLSYTASESFFNYTIDPKTKEVKFKPDDSEAQLYLAYVNLIEHRPEEAAKCIQSFLKVGGLKGTVGELAVIHKIMEGAPELAPIINTPEFIAVRAQLLYWCSDLKAQRKDFRIPDLESLPNNILKEQYKELAKFKASLPQLTVDTLNKYNNIRKHIPLESNLRLSSLMEHQLLRRNRAKIKKDPKLSALKARYYALRKEQLSQEKHFITDIKGPENQARLDKIVAKLSKKRRLKAQAWETVTQLMEVPNSTLASKSSIRDVESKIKNGKSPYYPMNLKVDMSDEEFLDQFQAIYRVARKPTVTETNSDHEERQKLTQFIDKILQANCFIPTDKQKSLIPSWAAVLSVVIKNQHSFPKEAITREHSSYSFSSSFRQISHLDEIFKKAHELSPTVKVQFKGHITEEVEQSIDGRYEKPMPIVIINKPDDPQSPYNNLMDKTGLSDFNKAIKKLSETTKADVKRLQDELRSKVEGKRYIDTIDLISECDEKIGNLKYKETQDNYEITKKYLAKESVRAGILTHLNTSLSDLQKNIETHKKAALELANKPPQDAQALARYELELSAGTRKKLELADLNRLFVLADFNEYRKVTGLSDHDIQVLHDTLANYMYDSVTEAHFAKVKEEVEKLNKLKEADFEKPENQVQITEFGVLIAKKNQVPYTDAALQFFQKEEGILIKPEQMDAFNQLVTKGKDGKFSNTVIQLTMGAGKSKVIMPTTALKKADGSNVVIQVVKSALLQVSYADMCEKSARLFNRIPYLFKFERVPLNFKAMKAADGTHYFQSDIYKGIYDDLQHTMIQKNCVITDDTSLKTLALQLRDTLRLDPPPPVNTKEREEWLRQITQLDRLVNAVIKKRGDMMIDEGHHILDPSQELNFTVGASDSPPPEDIQLHADLFYFCQGIKLNIEGIPRNTTAYDLIKQNNLISAPKTQMPMIMRAIARGLVTDKTPANPLKYLADLLKTDDQREAMIDYLMNEKPDLTSLGGRTQQVTEILDELTLRQRDEVAFIKFDLSRVLPFTMLKKYNQDYGSPKIAGHSEVEELLPCPYAAVHTPKKRKLEGGQGESVSAFGQFVEALNYTAQKNLIDPLSDTLVKEVIQSYLDQATEERRADPRVPFDQTKASLTFNRSFCQGSGTHLEEIAGLMRAKGNKKLEERLEEIIKAFRNSQAFRKAILVEKAAPLIKINPTVLSSDSLELGRMSNTVQVMTGTPFNYRTYHPRIQFDEIQNLGIDGETLALLKSKRKNIQVKSCKNYTSVYEFLEEMMPACPQSKLVRAIIEVGGWFVKESSSLEMAKEVDRYFKNHPDALSNPMRFILYVDTKDDILYALNTQNQEVIELKSSDEKFISERLKCTPAERFTIYDNNRITGTDIVQMPNAHAFVTIKEGTLLSSFVQGDKRLRLLANDQSLTVAQPEYLTPYVEANIGSSLKYTQANQVDKCLPLHFKASVNTFKDAIREDLLKRVDNEPNAFNKSILYKVFDPLLITTSRLSYFELYGQVDTELGSQLYFEGGTSENGHEIEGLASIYYKLWLTQLEKATELSDLALSLSQAEKEQMRNKLNDLAKKAVLICAQTIKAQVGNEDQEVENEIENEIEVENRLAVYDDSLQKNDDPAFIFDIKKFPITSENQTTLISASDSELILKGGFDKNLFMSKQQAWTLKNGGPQGERLDAYHNGYTKPIATVMMIATKVNPDSLQAVILTTNEAQLYLKQTYEELDKNYPGFHVWFVSPQGTVEHGLPPEKMPESYNRILEQVRFINGDVRKILQQKEGIVWLLDNVNKKLRFLRDKVLSWLPSAQNKLYKVLVATTKRVLMTKEDAEKERAYAHQKAEKARLAAELARQQAEKAAAEKAEAERLAQEKAQAEIMAQEKAKAEKEAAEKAQAERLAAEQALEKATEEAEIQAAQQKLIEKQEAERLAKEKAEQEKAELEKATAERLEAEKLAQEKLLQDQEAQKQAKIEKANQDQAEAEAEDAEHLVREKTEEESRPEKQAALRAAEKEREAAPEREKEEATNRLSVQEVADQQRKERAAKEKERLAKLAAEKEAEKLAQENRMRESREATEKEAREAAQRLKIAQANEAAAAEENRAAAAREAEARRTRERQRENEAAAPSVKASEADTEKKPSLNLFQKFIRFIKETFYKIGKWFSKQINKLRTKGGSRTPLEQEGSQKAPSQTADSVQTTSSSSVRSEPKTNISSEPSQDLLKKKKTKKKKGS